MFNRPRRAPVEAPSDFSASGAIGLIANIPSARRGTHASRLGRHQAIRAPRMETAALLAETEHRPAPCSRLAQIPATTLADPLTGRQAQMHGRREGVGQ